MNKITIQFQQGDGVHRPDDASLTNVPLPTANNFSDVPVVGDYFTLNLTLMILNTVKNLGKHL